MFLEKLFGNTVGLILLISFMVIVLFVVIFLFAKKEKITHVNVDDSSNIIDEISNNEVEATVENVIEEQVKDEVKIDLEYVIVEGEDGFFRVKKIGSEKTLRKLSTREEAEVFIKQKENKQ